MTQEHISFPSINQFKNIVKYFRDGARFHEVPLPRVTFRGTVKLHGTNHGIIRPVVGGIDDIYTQSRERITTVTSDNAGSAIWTHANRELLNKIFDNVVAKFNNAHLNDTVQIYGEFCGGNIQKGVGLAHLPKMFVVFGIRVSENAESNDWFTKEEILNVLGGVRTDTFKCIYDFPDYVLDIDFANPEMYQNKLVNLTFDVEQDCPVARQLLGSDFAEILVGEGIVWSAISTDQPKICIDGVNFKVKGEKHSASKVKTVASVDMEKVASVQEFVDLVATENRLNQGISKLEEMGLPNDSSSTGAFIQWVMKDVIKEEIDVLAESGLTTKDVTGRICSVAREFFLKQL